MSRAIYKRHRPDITISHVKTTQPFRCCTESVYKITSTNKLNEKQIKHLIDAGLVGFGQSVRLISKADGTEEPEGWDEVLCIDESDGTPARNPYTKELYGTSKFPYYSYEINAFCDSGD